MSKVGCQTGTWRDVWNVLAPRLPRVAELGNVPWRDVGQYAAKLTLLMFWFPALISSAGLFAVLVNKKPLSVLTLSVLIGVFLATLLILLLTALRVFGLIGVQREIDRLTKREREALSRLGWEELRAEWQRLRWLATMKRWSVFSPDWEARGPDFAAELRARNRRIDWLACAFLFVGAVLPFVVFGGNFDSVGWPAVGLMFGAMALFPLACICLATLPFGLRRHMEFWLYYEIRHGGLGNPLICLVPCALLGIASAATLIARALW